MERRKKYLFFKISAELKSEHHMIIITSFFRCFFSHLYCLYLLTFHSCFYIHFISTSASLVAAGADIKLFLLFLLMCCWYCCCWSNVHTLHTGVGLSISPPISDWEWNKFLQWNWNENVYLNVWKLKKLKISFIIYFNVHVCIINSYSLWYCYDYRKKGEKQNLTTASLSSSPSSWSLDKLQ